MSAGAGPGDTNTGQFHLVTAAAEGPDSTHAAVEIDFRNPISGSYTDLPAGSRFYMTMLARSSSADPDVPNLTYIVSNLWRWDYSELD